MAAPERIYEPFKKSRLFTNAPCIRLSNLKYVYSKKINFLRLKYSFFHPVCCPAWPHHSPPAPLATPLPRYCRKVNNERSYSVIPPVDLNFVDMVNFTFINIINIINTINKYLLFVITFTRGIYNYTACLKHFCCM